jgi:hypothetical protein
MLMANDNKQQPDYVTKRLNYFDGQYLSVKDFQDEQIYHIDRQRRLGRFLHVSGVLDGLVVETEGAGVKINPGSAIDQKGQQILVPQGVSIAKSDIKTASGVAIAQNQSLVLVLVYSEVAADKQSQQGADDYTRFDETASFQWMTETDASTVTNGVKLAKVSQDNSNQLVVDRGFCQYSGVCLPSDGAGQGPILRSGGRNNPNLAILTGSLSITNNVGNRTVTIGSPATTSTGTISSSGSTVTGTGTAFQTQLQVGDSITATYTANGQAVTQSQQVKTIAGGTSLTTETAFNPPIPANTNFTFRRPEICFSDFGQIKSLDNNHRILFRRSENILELREYGDILLSAGATSGQPTQSMCIKRSGNVGIGTTSPSAKLHIEGGSLSVNGDAAITGSLSFGQLLGLERLSIFGEWEEREKETDETYTIGKTYTAKTDGIVHAWVRVPFLDDANINLTGRSPSNTVRQVSYSSPFASEWQVEDKTVVKIALSEDCALIGAVDGSGKGSVYVYQVDNQGDWTWDDQPKRLQIEDPYIELTSAIFKDCVFIIAQDVVHVYQRDEQGNWNLDSQPKRLQAPVNNAYFGGTIALSEDRAFIGNANSVYVYQRDEQGNWNLDSQQERIRQISNANYGSIVALSEDCAFTRSLEENAGGVYVYEWNWDAPRLLQQSDKSGLNIAISQNCTLISFGQNLDIVTYAYQRDHQGNWNWDFPTELPLVRGSLDGASIAVSEKYVLIGANVEDNNRGAVYVYQCDERGNWNFSTNPERLQSSGVMFGSSITLFKDTFVVGKYASLDDQGHLIFDIYKPKLATLTMPVSSGDTWNVSLDFSTRPSKYEMQVRWLPLQLS